MFDEISIYEYGKPPGKRRGGYRWKPAQPGNGRCFYQHGKRLAMDEAGSTFRLRLEEANDYLPVDARRATSYSYDSGFTDYKPIVALLPHGRGFLAGWTMGGGMLASLDATIWDTIEEAAEAAHDDARQQCERDAEYDARCGEEESEED